MAIGILGVLTGAVVLIAGLYYRGKEKDDPESRRIYGVISTVGGVVAAAAAVALYVRVF